MPSRPCLTCGELGLESYCAAHRPAARPSRSTPGRGSGGQIAKFRAAVLRLAGGQCEAVIQGERCDVTDPRLLEAHHVRGLRAGGTNDAASNGVALCRAHHRHVEREQRQSRWTGP